MLFVIINNNKNIKIFKKKNEKLLASFPLMVCLGVLRSSFTICSDSKVMKQKPFLWFLVLSNGISTSTICNYTIQQKTYLVEERNIP